jgi:hypothetical protein
MALHPPQWRNGRSSPVPAIHELDVGGPLVLSSPSLHEGVRLPLHGKPGRITEAFDSVIEGRVLSPTGPNGREIISMNEATDVLEIDSRSI